MNAQDRRLVLEVRIGSTLDLLRSFDRREVDVAIVRLQTGRDDGRVIAEERFSWFAAPDWHPAAGEPLPVATMPEPCGIRSLAGDLLDAAGISWTEIFVGGGVMAVAAAVTAKLGVAALARRMLPLGVVDAGPRLGLPTLPIMPIVLHARVSNDKEAEAVSVLSAAFASAVAAQTRK
jgi:DNA-binding transcriptional LysR family regulator